jgi:hypothetical protein
MQNRLVVNLHARRLELKYAGVAGLFAVLLLIISTNPLFSPVESDLLAALETAVGIGFAGLFAIAFMSNLVVIINIPFMLVALPWVVADPSPAGMLLFSLSTGIGAGLGKLVAFALAERVAARFRSLSGSPLPTWISHQIERRPLFAPALVFLAAGTVLPLDPVLIPLLLVGYPVRSVAAPLLLGKIAQSLTMALVIGSMSASLGIGGGMSVDVTLGVVLGTLVLIAYQIEKGRMTHPPLEAR